MVNLIGGIRIEGVLYERYGHRVIYDAQSKLEAQLSTVIRMVSGTEN
jgi:hypothetical protein